MTRIHWIALAAFGLTGCITTDERPIVPVVAQKATAEIPQDEAVCRTAPRLLSQDDIRRLIEESRRRKERAAPRVSPHEK